MYCLTDMCYVCLEKKDKSLININSSLSVNKDILHIIAYLPFNLGWLKTKRIILICEECCRRLRDTYQLLAMCLKNSAVLQGYMDKLNTDVDNEAEPRVYLNNKPDDINRIKCEIKLEDEEIYTVGPIIDETEDVFVNGGDFFVKEEDTCNREEVDGGEEPPMDNNPTESSDNEWDVHSNIHDTTDTDSDSSEATSTQGHTTNKKELNTPANNSHKCLTCSKTFSRKSVLLVHVRTHTGETPYKCATCKKCFAQQSHLIYHMRTHTGEKPLKCTTCEKCFSQHSSLARHMWTHTGEKPHKCATCEKCFAQQSDLVNHMRTHTGEKPHVCGECKKCFTQRVHLVSHMSTHTVEKSHKCATCEKCFAQQYQLMRHMRTHTVEKPHKCATCEKCFAQQHQLMRHMRSHTGEKPHKCATCEKCFTRRSHVVRHMRTHTGVKLDE